MSNPVDGFQVTSPIEKTVDALQQAASPEVDNLVMAENMFKVLFGPFSQGVDKASNKQLRRLMKLLVQFPFIEQKLTSKTLPTAEEKTLFMLAERLIHSNMIRRANAELKRTFDEVAKEESETPSDVASGEASNDDGSDEA